MLFYLHLLIGGLFGLVLGSFGNSVVYRLPRKMRLEWLQAARDEFKQDKALEDEDNPLLSATRSGCPQCHATIAWYDNIPLFSWMLLRGKCRQCEAPISVRYPLLELGGALLGIGAVALAGLSLQAAVLGLAGLLLLWLLCIDVEHQLLPDALIFPLAGLGLLSALFGWFVSPAQAILGMLAGYVVLVVPAFFYRRFRGIDGLGDGDKLLLAAIGTFIGSPAIVWALLIGCVLTLAAACFRPRHQGGNGTAPLPFGPGLIVGGVVMFLAQQAFGVHLN